VTQLRFEPKPFQICLSIYLSIYLPIYLPTYLPTYLSIYLSIYLWHYSPFVGFWPLFQSLILYTIVRSSWMGDQPIARPILTEHKQNKRTQTSMSRVGFVPTITAFKRAKKVHAAAVIGKFFSIFFSCGATAPIWSLAYFHETLRFTSVF
jgi:hypothetical protein